MSYSLIRIFLIPVFSFLTMMSIGQEKALEYLFRYNCHRNPTADHLMAVEQLSPNRVIVAGNLGLALLNPSKLPVEGTQESIQQYTEFNIRNIYIKENYVYANINSTSSKVIPGFDIFKVENDKITQIKSIYEPGVFFEKMCVNGDYLYVTAHSRGIRIYDITNREIPQLTGTINKGFSDAYDIFVYGDSAYVADGHGGLKIVDVSDKKNPVLVFAEIPENTIGTSQAITADAKSIYLIAGSEGLVVYKKTNPEERTIIPTGCFVEDYTWAGDLLAVTCYSKVLLYKIDEEGLPRLVAHEQSDRRESKGTMRLSAGAGCMNDTILMCANWNFLDFYNIKDVSEATQADINCSANRIRYHVNGGSRQIAISNNGYGTLEIKSITTKNNAFTTDFKGAQNLAHNDTLWLNITYSPSGNEDDDVILIESNDIDENPFPIQVYGKTKYMDPGEKAVDFSYPFIQKDTLTGEYNQSDLTLSNFKGKVVYFAIFGSSCPACPPVISDMQTRIVNEFKDNQDVMVFMYNGKKNETLSRIEEYFDWYYMNMGLVFDESAQTFYSHYEQLRAGLPWGKSYIIDQQGIISKAMFGYNPDMIIQTIYEVLENQNTEIKGPEINTNDFGLKAYPNPFSDAVHLEFSVTHQDDIIIDLYDISGKKLKTITNKSYAPGHYKIFTDKWSKFGKGIYYCKLRNNLGQTSTLELMLTN